jgi:hypothetical protein
MPSLAHLLIARHNHNAAADDSTERAIVAVPGIFVFAFHNFNFNFEISNSKTLTYISHLL